MDVQSSQSNLLKRVGLAAIILMQLLSGSIFVGIYQLLTDMGSQTANQLLGYGWQAWIANCLIVFAWLLFRRRWYDRLVFWWSFAVAVLSVALMALVMTSTIQV